MKLKLFAIKDNALDAFGPTFQQATVSAGLRTFKDLVTYGDESNRYRRNPEDYVLYQVGEYDDESGQLFDTKNVRLASAVETQTEERENVT